MIVYGITLIKVCKAVPCAYLMPTDFTCFCCVKN